MARSLKRVVKLSHLSSRSQTD